MNLTKPENYVQSKADRAVCLGSGELRPCPFCGKDPITGGKVNEETGNYVHDVICPGCMVHMHCCMKGNQRDEARAEVIRKWNARVVK